MSAYQVAVVADDSNPAASAAVVRIEGLQEWPQNGVLRILPIDEASVPPHSEGWPWGDISPLRVMPTVAGVDIVLGPDVVGCARLTPGTPITIQVPAVQLEVEARWPSMTPTVRRRAAAVAMSASQMMAAKAEREQAARQIAARRQEMAEFAARSNRELSLAPANGQPATGAAATTPPARPETGQLARLLQLRRPDAPATLPGGQAAATLSERPPPGPTSTQPVPAPPPAAPPVRSRRRGRGLWTFLAGMAATVVVAAAAASIEPAAWLPPALSGATTTAGDADRLDVAALQDLFKELAATGPLSPQNKSAAGVDVATALSLADHSLRGERTPAETEEAVYWLKRALTGSFGGADVGWALTQLGTVYATPGTVEHSYVKAHNIWQLAATQGDPVAHCFLGALYEHGLGVARNRKVALDHYKAAARLGACNGAQDAAARMSE